MNFFSDTIPLYFQRNSTSTRTQRSYSKCIIFPFLIFLIYAPLLGWMIYYPTQKSIHTINCKFCPRRKNSRIVNSIMEVEGITLSQRNTWFHYGPTLISTHSFTRQVDVLLQIHEKETVILHKQLVLALS